MQPGKVEIILDPKDGSVTFIHSDEAMRLAAGVAGVPSVRRASHVEPIAGTARWEADLSPVGGPVLGPFATKQEALDSEVAWLNENRLYCRECRDEAGDQVPGQPSGLCPPDADRHDRDPAGSGCTGIRRD